MSGNPFGIVRDLVARHADIDRPLRVAEVVNTDAWAASGPSFVTVRVLGRLARAAYRDAPEPAIGALLQVVRMGADAAAGYLALPLPQPSGQCGQFYVSGQSLTDGTWDVIRCDPGVGAVWQHRSDHPLGDSGYPRRPLQRATINGTTLPNSLGVRATPNRLFTWGTDLDYSGPGTMHYSDDDGATWAASGLAPVNLGNIAHEGRMFANDQGDVYSSMDGVSWASIGSVPGGTIYDTYVTEDPIGSPTVYVYTSAGLYRSLVSAGTAFGGWSGPWTPGAGTAGYVRNQPFQSYFDGTDYYQRTSGTPGAGVYVGSLAGKYAAGAGHFFPETYLAADHPGGLAVPIAGWAFANPGAGLFDYCQIFGLADSTIGAGHTRYMGRPDGTAGTYTVLDSRQATDLGAHYLPSPDGLSH